MASAAELAALVTAPIIYSLGKGPRDVLLSEHLNTQLELFGLACVRLSDGAGSPLSAEAARGEAISWQTIKSGQFLPAGDPIFGSKDWTYHGTPFGNMQLLNIKSSHPGLPVDLRAPHWLFDQPAEQQKSKKKATKKHCKRKMTDFEGDNDDVGDSDCSSTPPPSARPPSGGPDARTREARKAGVGWLDLSIVLGSSDVTAFEDLETHYRYCSAEQREELFWSTQRCLSSPALSNVPMPASLTPAKHLDEHPWSLYHLAKQTELPIILNELLSSNWAREHPGCYLEPPYPGVQTPYLYHTAALSFFPMHIEDYALPALNWLLRASPSFSYLAEPSDLRRDAISPDDELAAGADGGVVWYCCPASSYTALCDFAGKYIAEQYRTPEILAAPFSCARWLFNPVDLHKAGIPVTRFVQHPGDIMVTGPGALHWGINLSTTVKVGSFSIAQMEREREREREDVLVTPRLRLLSTGPL